MYNYFVKGRKDGFNETTRVSEPEVQKSPNAKYSLEFNDPIHPFLLSIHAIRNCHFKIRKVQHIQFLV